MGLSLEREGGERNMQGKSRRDTVAEHSLVPLSPSDPSYCLYSFLSLSVFLFSSFSLSHFLSFSDPGFLAFLSVYTLSRLGTG